MEVEFIFWFGLLCSVRSMSSSDNRLRQPYVPLPGYRSLLERPPDFPTHSQVPHPTGTARKEGTL